MKQDNRIVVDLNKVQWGRFYYENQHGDKRNLKPKEPTVYGGLFNPLGFCISTNGLRTMIELAIEKNILDIWTPVVVFKLTAHETLKYKGDKAVSLYKSWCEKVFNKKRKK